MKKFLLFMTVSFAAFMANAQVICYVNSPSPHEGNYDFTYAQGTGWSVPDLTNPVNAIEDTMMFVTNGTDSLSCSTLTNDLTGKIAVLYRGSCEFGTKALNAQNAGAIGVIIINNLAGAPVAMGGGADGASVTIPVVMISNTDGALLKAEIEAGNTTVFIGSKNGLYPDDIGMTPDDYLRAESFGVVSLMNQDNTEFEVEVGSWVRNYGTNDQSDVTLNCTVVMSSVTIYDETSAALTIPSGDSVYVTLPNFSQTSYANGLYEMTYTVNMSAFDSSDYDNTQECDFYFSDSLFSLARLDPATNGKPIQTTNQYNSATDLMETCLHFRDPNASRVGILGMTFSAGTSQNPDPTSTDGQFVEIYAYEWNDVFTDFTDYPDWTSADLTEIARGEYIYTSNKQSENVFIQFEDLPILVDDQRYLFCLNAATGLYPGYDTHVNYTGNFDNLQQPLNVMRIDFAQWYAAGFGTDQSPSISVHMYDANEAGLVELPEGDLDVYPNPATETVTIPLKENKGDAELVVYNLSGAVVSTQNVSMNGNALKLDVSSIANGTYVVNVNFANGEKSAFNVVVKR